MSALCSCIMRRMSEDTKSHPPHGINCGYHLDQYPQECDCGATNPRADYFVPYEPPKREPIDYAYHGPCYCSGHGTCYLECARK